MIRMTISGIWTAAIIVIVLSMLLFVITRGKNTYAVINPVIIIACTLMIVLRMSLPVEWKFARGIFIPELVPKIDTMLRTSLFKIGGRNVLIWNLLLCLWVAGAVIRIFSLAWEYRSARKILNYAEPLDLKYMQTVRMAEKDMGVSEGILYKRSGNYDVPFIFGILRPIVMLPEACMDLEEKELYMMVRHELSHYRKKDCLVKMILELFAGIFWWLPFVKRLMGKLDEAIEIRADKNAVKTMSEEEKTEYLMTLYHMADRSVPKKGILNANTFISGQINMLERRFKAIANPGKWRFTNIGFIFIACIFILSYGFVIVPKYDSDDGSLSCEKSCAVYKQSDGRYQVYMDGKYLGITDDIEFLKSPDFDNVEKILVEEVSFRAKK